MRFGGQGARSGPTVITPPGQNHRRWQRFLEASAGLLLWLMGCTPLSAQTTNGTWIGAGGANTNWINPANWASLIIAGGINSTATFAAASGYSVRLTGTRTNGHVILDGSSNYTFFSSGGSWKYHDSSGTSTLQVLQRTNTLNLTPVLNSTNLDVDVAAGAHLSLNSLSAPDPTRRTVTKAGAGTLRVTSGSATALNADWRLEAGVLVLSSPNGLGHTNSDLTFDGGTLHLLANLNPQASRALTVGASGGRLTFGGNYTLTLDDTNQLGGAGLLEVAGSVPAQKLTISRPQPAFAGTIQVSGGQLLATHPNALGGGLASVHVFTNGSLAINSFTNQLVVSNLTFNGGAFTNFNVRSGLAVEGTYSDGPSNTLALGGLLTSPYQPGGLTLRNGQANTVYGRIVPVTTGADPVFHASGASTTVDFRNRTDVSGRNGSDFTFSADQGATLAFTSDATINTMRTATAAVGFWLRSDPAGAQGTVRFDPGFVATATSSNRLYNLSLAGARWITSASANLPTNGVRFEGQTNGIWRTESLAQTLTGSLHVRTNGTVDTASDLTVSSLLMQVPGVTLTKTGTATLQLNPGTYTFVNPTALRILEGQARLNAVWSEASPSPTLDLQPGATLGGIGKAGAVISTGGILQPGLGLGPGIYAQFSAKQLTLDVDSTLSLRLGGTGAGQFDSIRTTTGTLTLGNAALDLSLDPGFSATLSSTLRIADVNAALINGTFQGLPEGASLNAGSYTFTISYVGGTGNDAVLTVAAVPEPAAVALITLTGLGIWTVGRRRRGS